MYCDLLIELQDALDDSPHTELRGTPNVVTIESTRAAAVSAGDTRHKTNANVVPEGRASEDQGRLQLLSSLRHGLRAVISPCPFL